MDNPSFNLDLERGEGYRFTVTFDQPGVPQLLLDEPEPLGDGDGPNAARVLAAAVGNCLSASLLFCLGKTRIEPAALHTTVEGEIVRNERGRLRIGTLKVRIHPSVTDEERERMGRCLDLFEDFCIVTQSVRDGIDVDVEVVAEAAPEAVPAGG